MATQTHPSTRFVVVPTAALTPAEKAVEVLAKVPAPPAEVLAKKLTDLDDKARLPIQLYRQARLETARALRTAGRFSDADKTLAEALGTQEKPGWAAGAAGFLVVGLQRAGDVVMNHEP